MAILCVDFGSNAETQAALRTYADLMIAELERCNEVEAIDESKPAWQSGPTFSDQLKDLINRNSMENGSNTPDFILARFLTDAMEAFDRATNRRSEWRGETTTFGSAAEEICPEPEAVPETPESNRFQKMTIEELAAWWVFRQMDGEPSGASPQDVFSWTKHVQEDRETVELELLADYGDNEDVFGSN